ncbi:hypothetical protein SEA_GRANDSLAM_61 [Gordonia phage GrandSlam]|nr:hypothetical protein SEA_GRANDSLAM_61 [Gordonia phage GrandSlam]
MSGMMTDGFAAMGDEEFTPYVTGRGSVRTVWKLRAPIPFDGTDRVRMSVAAELVRWLHVEVGTPNRFELLLWAEVKPIAPTPGGFQPTRDFVVHVSLDDEPLDAGAGTHIGSVRLGRMVHVFADDVDIDPGDDD